MVAGLALLGEQVYVPVNERKNNAEIIKFNFQLRQHKLSS
jgi:hypothetical protein